MICFSRKFSVCYLPRIKGIILLWMLNYQDYDEDFRQLGLNENEQKVVLDFFHQLGEILFNNKIEKLLQDE